MSMKKFALRGLVILAAAVALCIFFSGTVRTLTTPRVRFAQARMGKMEQETALTGKVTFPETAEIKIAVPEGLSLTVTRVYAAPGARVKAGETLLTARVTDGEKTMEGLKKDLSAAQKELRALEKSTAEIRLTRGEQQWQAAWEKEEQARGAEWEARVAWRAALTQAGLDGQGDALPEEADEELTGLYDAWRAAEENAAQAAEELAGLERYAISETAWNLILQKREQTEKIAALEDQMTALQVLARTAEKIQAPWSGYVSEVLVEKDAAADGDTVLLRMTAEGTEPVIRLDLGEVKQEVRPGTVVTLESDSWSRPSVKVVKTGLTLEGRPYADAEITQDVTYALGSVSAMMKENVKARLTVRSADATCLLPAAAVRGSGEGRYVYVGRTESSAFGGSRMKAEKMSVTVLAESGATVSVVEDLTYLKVLYMEDRALTEGGAVMEYSRD